MDSRLLMIGIPLGLLIGILAGLYVVLLLKDATIAHPHARYSLIEKIFGRRPVPGARIAGRIAGVIALCVGGYFGGGWFARLTAFGVDWEELLPVYFISLVAVFVPIVAYPLIRLIIRVGRDLG